MQACFATHCTGFDPDTRHVAGEHCGILPVHRHSIFSFEATGWDSTVHGQLLCQQRHCHLEAEKHSLKPQYACTGRGCRQKDFSKILQNLEVSRFGACSETVVPIHGLRVAWDNAPERIPSRGMQRTFWENWGPVHSRGTVHRRSLFPVGSWTFAILENTVVFPVLTFLSHYFLLFWWQI